MPTVGHFEVLEKLGAGGMGEVYKARDQKLNRSVALKFLPEGANTTARERFQREALAIAALNHPHVCTLYETGEQDGRPYLVMELLEGETLRARLTRGPVAAAQLVDWGGQVADALDAAHKRGVLHRDLKPDNIWVLPGGHIKVLDFGLAQLQTEAVAGGEDRTLTSPGATLGTVPYMSPEQAKGEPLDARSDLFSFGSVFYEMASGKQPFPAKTAAETIAAVLKDQPPALSRVRPELPPKVEEITERCLEKDPDLRYQSAADLRSELKRLSRSGSTHAESAPATPPVSSHDSGPMVAAAAPSSDSQILGAVLRRHWRWPVLGVAAVVIAAGAWWRFGPRGATPPPALQFRQLTFNGNVVDAVISPDGKFLAHVDNGPQGTSLHLLSIASGSDVQIMPPAPGCCSSPTFSPDGGQVYFLQGNDLRAIPVLGGAARLVATHACSGAGFSPDGSQITYLNQGDGTPLMLANTDGTNARVLNTAAGGGYSSQCWVDTPGAPTHSPTFSPDGRWIAVGWGPASGTGHLVLVDAHTGSARGLGPTLYPTAADVNWLPDGSGLVLTSSIPDNSAPQLWRLSYPGGQLTQLTNDLQGYTGSSLAASGQIALVHAAPQASIWMQAKAGGEFTQVAGGGSNQDGLRGLAWTREGGLVSFRNLGGKPQLWRENSDGSDARPLVTSGMPTGPYDPQIAPDGHIFFNDDNNGRIWQVNGDGSGLSEVLPAAKGEAQFGGEVISGGRELLYMKVDRQGNQFLWVAPLAGGAPRQVWSGFVLAGNWPVSPDGKRTFVSARGPNKSRQGVIVRLDGGQPQAVTVTGFDPATMPGPWSWTPDGRAITYVQRKGNVSNIWALPIDGGKPYPLTHFTDLEIGTYRFGPDGRLAVSRGSRNSDAVLATPEIKH